MTLAAGLVIAALAGSITAVTIAMALWLRDRRGGSPSAMRGEPSPADAVAVGVMGVCAVTGVGVRTLASTGASLGDVLLPAAVLGFGSSAVRSLLTRRGGVDRVRFYAVAAALAVVVGAASALASG